MTTTFKDADGREWALVPKTAHTEMISALLNAVEHERKCHALSGSYPATYTGHAEGWQATLAAAPKFVPPVVTDEVAQKVCKLHFENFGNRDGARSGRDMIAAVQQVLGPQLGLVPREWVIDLIGGLECTLNATTDSESMTTGEKRQRAWAALITARKRIEGNGNG